MWTSTELAHVFPESQELFNRAVTGISIDSRTLQTGDIFFALKGETSDGHLFVKDAYKKGAAYIIVEKLLETIPEDTQVVVPDTLKALEDLATFTRNRTSAKVIGVTGSVGKTTVKELLAHILQNFGKTTASKASYNNHIGVPFTLCHIEQDTRYAVIEMGMNHPGEIAPLSMMARPNIGVITSIAPSHIGPMGSMEAIAEEKGSIFKGLVTGGTAIIPTDIPEFPILLEKAKTFHIQDIATFGKNAHIATLESYKPSEDGLGSNIEVILEGITHKFFIQMPGEHSAYNAILALLTCVKLGLKPGDVIPHISSFTPVQGRGQRHTLSVDGKEIILIDDAYNANPASMRAGLSVLASTKTSLQQNRRIAVLGDMKELGSSSMRYHQEICQVIESLGIELVFAAGTDMKHMFDNLPENKRGGYADTAENVVPLLRQNLQNGDVVLVKGSKGSYISKVVDDLKKAGACA